MTTRWGDHDERPQSQTTFSFLFIVARKLENTHKHTPCPTFSQLGSGYTHRGQNTLFSPKIQRITQRKYKYIKTLLQWSTRVNVLNSSFHPVLVDPVVMLSWWSSVGTWLLGILIAITSSCYWKILDQGMALVDLDSGRVVPCLRLCLC